MKIRMHETINGSVDGIRVQLYEAGKEYDLTFCQGARDLASAFVGARMAAEVVDDAPAVAPCVPASEVDVVLAPTEAVAPVIEQPTPEHRGRKSKK
jgi:hypothetical protein